ncbi:MAG TPA: hypothetical protein PL182_07780 [Pseudobdellovibrionaceae bacterium]|nr:hypothetical protein [Pseudobdellovibrionaceae bacterium]
MKKKPSRALMSVLCLSVAVVATSVARADEESRDEAVSKCLASWGTHPFGKSPKYKTLATAVKVFGIGGGTKDSEKTEEPSLVLGSNETNAKDGVTVMGSTKIERFGCP